MMKFGTVINFCSNDYPFLRHCIDAIKPVSEQIIVPACDHFFDGKKEDRETLDLIYAENGDVEFIEFPFDKEKSLYGSHPSSYWHNLARMIGNFFLKKEIQYVLFLDCDEIADAERLLEWQSKFPYFEYEAIRLAGYWYFREARFQAKTWENTPLLVKREAIDGALLMNPRERGGIFDHLQGKKKGKVLGLDGKPMFHHYSWVRTKEQMLRKVASWGHNWERNWTQEVEREFSHPFNGIDFIHGYEFVEVTPYVCIDLMKRPAQGCLSTICKLSHSDVMKIDMASHFQIPASIDKNFS